jgi:hypothetical protein
MDPMAAMGGAPAAPGPLVPNPAAPVMEGKMMHRVVDEIFSRVSGFFNENNGTFTIGEEGFITKMCKELKEKYRIDPKNPKAEMFDRMVEGACNRIMEKLKQRHSHSRELSDMRRMAGIMEADYDPMSAARSLSQRDIGRSLNKANQLPSGQGSGMFSQGAFGGMDPQGMMKDIQSKIPAGNMKTTRTSSGTINGQPASYDDAMGKFKGMAGGMGFDASGDDPVGGMYKGIQGKFGDMMKGMNMPSNMMGNDEPMAATSALDLKTALAKMKPATPDDAMKMLGDLKKLAGLPK